jgi:16S rRNA (uracil1498-N3)-methyltransferase
LKEGEVTLRDSVARYVAGARRIGAGEEILLFDPATAREAVALVVSVRKAEIVCLLGPVRPSSAARAVRRVTLLQAIGKGDKFDAVVRHATELGATAIVAVDTERSVVRLATKGPGRLERWRRIAAEAARQSGRGDAPAISGPTPWAEAIAQAPNRALKVCLFEGASEPLGPHLGRLGPADAVVFAIGPEGGLETSEVETAQRGGFVAVSLGDIILRTETVAAAVLGGLRIVDQILQGGNKG